jgi:hypothetical protein
MLNAMSSLMRRKSSSRDQVSGSLWVATRRSKDWQISLTKNETSRSSSVLSDPPWLNVVSFPFSFSAFCARPTSAQYAPVSWVRPIKGDFQNGFFIWGRFGWKIPARRWAYRGVSIEIPLDQADAELVDG